MPLCVEGGAWEGEGGRGQGTRGHMGRPAPHRPSLGPVLWLLPWSPSAQRCGLGTAADAASPPLSDVPDMPLVSGRETECH